MTTLVADTSGLVSLGIAGGSNPDPLSVCLDAYDVCVPTEVIEELEEIASYNDTRDILPVGNHCERRDSLLVGR